MISTVHNCPVVKKEKTNRKLNFFVLCSQSALYANYAPEASDFFFYKQIAKCRII